MYHYAECGLRDVWLANGYAEHETPYGKGVSIEHADILHQVIALHLVDNKPKLTGAEFRFIRKELGMSQRALGNFIGKDVQSVARWEKTGRVPKMADRFLRIIYREHVDDDAAVKHVIERLDEIDQQAYRHDKMLFEETEQGWARKVA